MRLDDVIDKVCDIREKCGESDPIRLCRELGIIFGLEPMGAAKEACKGFFFRRLGVSMITVNSELTDTFRRIITAHELGHALLHAEKSEKGFLDYGYFSQADECETEANYFAAELLISDDDVLEAAGQSATYYELASFLYVPPELAGLKLKIMAHKGYELYVPADTKANFMGKMEVRYGEEF